MKAERMKTLNFEFTEEVTVLLQGTGDYCGDSFEFQWRCGTLSLWFYELGVYRVKVPKPVTLKEVALLIKTAHEVLK